MKRRLYCTVSILFLLLSQVSSYAQEVSDEEQKLAEQYIEYVSRHISPNTTITLRAPKEIDVEVYTWFPDNEDFISSLKNVICPLPKQLLDYGYVYNITCYCVDPSEYFVKKSQGESIILSRKSYVDSEKWKKNIIRKFEFKRDSSNSYTSTEKTNNKKRSVEECLHSLIEYWKSLEEDLFNISIMSVIERDVEPTFQGGSADEFSKWVQDNIDTQCAKLKMPKHIVLVQFTVNCEGRTSNSKIIDGADWPFAYLAITSLQNSPAWRPALKISITDDVVSSVEIREKTYVLPIIFVKKKYMNDGNIEKSLESIENIHSDSSCLNPAVVYVK